METNREHVQYLDFCLEAMFGPCCMEGQPGENFRVFTLYSWGDKHLSLERTRQLEFVGQITTKEGNTQRKNSRNLYQCNPENFVWVVIFSNIEWNFTKPGEKQRPKKNSWQRTLSKWIPRAFTFWKSSWGIQ